MDMNKDTEPQGIDDGAELEAYLEAVGEFIEQPQNRITADWDTIWAQRDTWDWNCCAGFADYGREPSRPEMLAAPIDAGQRRQLHRLHHSDAWIDTYLRNWAEAADVILFENFQTAIEGESLVEDEPTEEELLGYECDLHKRQALQEEAMAREARKDLLAVREHQRQQPVSVNSRDLLHTFGKPDAWIDRMLHNELEAVDFLTAEYPAFRARNTEKAVWLYIEVPEVAIASELVEQAKAHARNMAHQLGLPATTRVRWVEELGPEDAVGTRQLKARRIQWNCDLATLKAEHLVRIPLLAQRDRQTGRLQPIAHNMLGFTNLQEPNTINLLADHRRYDDWKSVTEINLPPHAFFTDAVLDVAFEDINTVVEAAWGMMIRNVVAFTARQLWQFRHFKPELLGWNTPLKVRDAAVYDTLTTSRSAFARIRGKRWFEEFVQRYAPLQAGYEPENEDTSAA